MKKNSRILIIPRFIGLRISEGFIARSVIFIPKMNPMNIVGKYAISIKYGDSVVIC
jgi:hypothetical protein